MQVHLTINTRAALVGVALLVAAAIATPFAISLADEPPPDASAARAVTLGTAFTYQGRLDGASGPANGPHDLRFQLYDDPLATVPTAGAPVLLKNATDVTGGLFTVDLDFGSGPFDGTLRYLQVAVKETGAAGGHSFLDPLQPLTVVPQAIFAQHAPWSGISGVPAGLDELAALNCADGEVPKESGGQWACATVVPEAVLAQHAPWSGLSGIPAGLDELAALDCADGQVPKESVGQWICGTDAIGTVGPGLALTGTQFSVQFLSSGGANGSSQTAARSDHNHLGQAWSGSAATGLQVTTTGSGTAVFGSTASGYGVRGLATSGLGVLGAASISNGTGIYGLGGATAWAGRFAGDVQIYGGGQCHCDVVAPSDLRLKRDVGTSTYGLAEVMALTPRSYRWNEGEGAAGVHLGFVAQEVETILPELVAETRAGTLGLDYDGLISVLTRAIQEQQEEIEALRTRLDAGAPSSTAAPGSRTAAASPAVPASALWALAGGLVLFALALLALSGALLARRRAPAG